MLVLAVTLLAPAEAWLGPVEARASACTVAKARLAKLNAPAKRYAGAVRQQRAQMKKTRSMLARHGCSRSRSAACRTLGTAYAKMRRNLRKLERGGVSASKRRRARARARRACGEFRPDRGRIARALGGTAVRPDRKRSSARTRERIARVRRARGVAVERAPTAASGSGTAAVATGQSQLRFTARFARGTYRTMCVRTCDGFAFPASLSTVPGRFHVDAARCAAMCPGRELRLFATKARSATVAQARDAETGQPYETLPFAFRYRKRYDAACKCDFKPVAVEDGRLAGGPVVAQPAASRVPTWRPAFPPVAVRPTAKAERTTPAPRTEAGVRIVGETYFPN